MKGKKLRQEIFTICIKEPLRLTLRLNSPDQLRNIRFKPIICAGYSKNERVRSVFTQLATENYISIKIVFSIQIIDRLLQFSG